jgi:glutamyl-tRNA reductase
VVRHLFMVASSLDSMVVGEAQILAQVKQAYELARSADTAGPLTNAVFQAAIRVAKRVASETAINQRRVSIPSVAVADFAAQIFERFDDKRVLVIGAGEMGEETLRYLRDEGLGTSRSATGTPNEPSIWLGASGAGDALGAVSRGGRGRGSGDRHDGLERAGLDVGRIPLDPPAAPAASDLHAGSGRSARLRSGDRGFLGGVPVLDRRPEAGLRSEPARAREGMAQGRADHRGRDGSVHGRIEPPCNRAGDQTSARSADRLRHEELQRLLNKLGPIDDRTRNEISRSFDRLVNKLLHPPLESLRDEARSGSPHGLLEALVRLFQLKD